MKAIYGLLVEIRDLLKSLIKLKIISIELHPDGYHYYPEMNEIKEKHFRL